MKITEIKENKKQYINLLLLADEQEDMIDLYLNRGIMYVLNNNGTKAICIITDEGNGILEIKNIATVPEHQHKGYGRKLIDFIVNKYKDKYDSYKLRSYLKGKLYQKGYTIDEINKVIDE
mgnify:CR=1 FL=1